MSKDDPEARFAELTKRVAALEKRLGRTDPEPRRREKRCGGRCPECGKPCRFLSGVMGDHHSHFVDRATGRSHSWDAVVPPGHPRIPKPVLDRIHVLRSQGYGYWRIAGLVGVSRTVVIRELHRVEAGQL